MSIKEDIYNAVSALKEQGIESAEVGIILGTGLGGLTEEIQVKKIVEYSSIPGFVNPTAEFHDGKLIFGILSGKNVIAMQGRFHYYEGYSMKEITFPLYVFKELGVSSLFVSNAAGNLNEKWNKGELMLFEDHINLLPENPLRGENDDSIGPRWPDMFHSYSSKLNDIIQNAAEKIGLKVRKGVYAAVQGPNLETRAEYKMLRVLGADAVGMSTVPEIIVAKYLDIPVCAISVLTDDCDEERIKEVNIKEIIELAGMAEKKMTALLKEAISSL